MAGQGMRPPGLKQEPGEPALFAASQGPPAPVVSLPLRSPHNSASTALPSPNLSNSFPIPNFDRMLAEAREMAWRNSNAAGGQPDTMHSDQYFGRVATTGYPSFNTGAALPPTSSQSSSSAIQPVPADTNLLINNIIRQLAQTGTTSPPDQSDDNSYSYQSQDPRVSLYSARLGELLPADRTGLAERSANQAQNREAPAHSPRANLTKQDNGDDKDSDAGESATTDIGRILVNLNNAAQAKCYRQYIDLYKKVGTDLWYGTVFIGHKEERLTTPERSQFQAKAKLAKIGLKMLKSMPKADSKMLEHFPKPPKAPPYGFHREPQALSRAEKTTSSKTMLREIAKRRPPPGKRSISVLRDFERRHVPLNFITMLNEWYMVAPVGTQMPTFKHRWDNGAFKHELILKLPGSPQYTFSSSVRGEGAQDASKRNVAEYGIAWLLDQDLIDKIDDDGHVRRQRKRPAEEDPAGRPEAKKHHTNNAPPANAPTGPRSTMLASSGHGVEAAAAVLVGNSGDKAATQARVLGEIDTPAPIAVTNVDVPAELPASQADNSGGSAMQQQQMQQQQQPSYVEMSAALSRILGYGQPQYYWMPSDPVNAPFGPFDCSAHLASYAPPDGVVGGAVCQLKGHLVDNVAAFPEAIAKVLYDWLDKQRDEVREQLEQRIQMLHRADRGGS